MSRLRRAVKELAFPARSEEEKQLIEGNGFRTYVPSITSHSHGYGATLRLVALAEILREIAYEGHAELLAPYDQGRVAKFCERNDIPINVRTLGGVGHHHDYHRPAAHQAVDRLTHGPVIVNDVYHGGAGSPTGLGATQLAEWCMQTTVRLGYIAFVYFPGEAGVDADQVWKRLPNGNVISRVDDYNHYVHPDTNWLLDQNAHKTPYGYLSVKHLRTIGTDVRRKLVMQFRLVDHAEPVENTLSHICQANTLVKKRVTTEVHRQWCGLKKETVYQQRMIISPIFHQLRMDYRGAAISRGFDLTVARAIRRAVAENPACARLQKHFPEDMEKWMDDTAFALTFGQQQEYAQYVNAGMKEAGEAIHALDGLWSNKEFDYQFKNSPVKTPPSEPSSFSWFPFFCLMLVPIFWLMPVLLGPACVVFLWKRRPRASVDRPKPTFLTWDMIKTAYDRADPTSFRKLVGFSPLPEDAILHSRQAHSTLKKNKKQNARARLSILRDRTTTQVEPGVPRPALQMILPTNGMLRAPTPGPYSLLRALEMRNMLATPDSHPEIWDDLLKTFSSHFGTFQHPPIEYNDAHIRDWITSIDDPRKRKRAIEIHRKLTSAELKPVRCDQGYRFQDDFDLQPLLRELGAEGLGMFAKTDETLPLKYEHGEYGLKPRTITSLPDIGQCLLQPVVREIDRRFKDDLKQAPFFIFGGRTTLRLWVTYASGMTAGGLSDWMNDALLNLGPDEWHLIVLGDDSLLLAVINGNRIAVEGDYSHYDNSQKDPQVKFETGLWRAFGAPKWAIKLSRSIAKMPSKWRKRGRKGDRDGVLKLVFEPGEMRRVTGAPNTSLSNTTNNIAAWYTVLDLFRKSPTHDLASFRSAIERGMNYVGFNMEFQILDPSDVTFLRGRWYKMADEDRRVWSWLPSCLGKMGKVRFNAPVTVREAAYSLGQNISVVETNIPVVGAFRQALVRNSLQTTVTLPHEAYRPTNSCRTVDRSEALDWIERRYAVPRTQVEQVEAELDSIDTLPSFYGHPAIARFMEVDYGCC